MQRKDTSKTIVTYICPCCGRRKEASIEAFNRLQEKAAALKMAARLIDIKKEQP